MAWRQRIGSFRMPAAKASRKRKGYKRRSSNVCESSYRCSMWWLVLFGTIFFLYAADSFIMQIPQRASPTCMVVHWNNESTRCDLHHELLLYGDIETNPGPSCFTDDQLETLKAGGELQECPTLLTNKHICQMFELRKKCGATWDDVRLWLAQCLNMQVTELPTPKALRKQFEKLTTKRKRSVKAHQAKPRSISEI